MTSSQANYLINGHANLALSPYDRGFSYGDGVFRTFSIYFRDEKQTQIWPLNYQKLVSDCNALGIVCPSADVLINDMYQLINPDEKAFIKIIITRGESARGYSYPPIATPTRVVMKLESPVYPAENFSDGVKLYLCKTRLVLQTQLAGIKHLNRLENVLARAEWHGNVFADGVMMNTEGDVIECTSSNIFVRLGRDLVTPDLSQCGVAGVTRQRIMALASAMGLNVHVRVIKLDELLQSDEVIICNSLFGVWRVSALEGKSWPQQPTDVTLKIRESL